jgi:hypothetical protein
MPSADVRYPLPLVRLNPWYPGQLPGVPGTDSETGLRPHCTGTVFYVDPNHVDNDDRRDGTNPTAPLSTVAAALAKCQAYRGDVIAVMANDGWQYGGSSDYTTPIIESVIVDVPGVRIVGVSPSGALGVYWQPATADGICITVNALDVTVEGFAFMGDGGGTAILAQYGVGNEGDNLVVRHCFFADDLDEGIILDFSWYVDIHHNMFDECDYGIYTNPVAMNNPAYARIHHNWFHDCPVSAISLQDADRCHIYKNTIYNNLAATDDPATLADCMIDLASGSRNSVHHNTLACVLPAAVAWDYNACNTAGIGDVWISNWLRNGPSTTNPA